MPDKWTNANVKVLPAPIAGHDRAAELLQQHYENSPTALKNIPMSEEELGDITFYNRIATNADKDASKGK